MATIKYMFFCALLAVSMTCRGEVSVVRLDASEPDETGAVTISWVMTGWQEPYSVYPIGRYNVFLVRMDTGNPDSISFLPGAYIDQSGVHGSYVDTLPANGETYYYWLCYAPYNQQNYTYNFAYRFLNGDYNGILTYNYGPVSVFMPKPLVLSASDGTVPGGIEVTWTDDGTAQYELFRGETAEGPFNSIAIVSTNAYFDSAVEWGRPYWYYVNRISGQKRSARLMASNGTDSNRGSNVNEGFPGADGELPKITKIDFPEFWLLENPNTDSENKFGVKWNNFNANKYRVSGFFVTAKQKGKEIGPIAYPGEKNKRWNDITIYWPFEEKLADSQGQITSRKKINAPGVWSLSISWTIDIIERDENQNVRGYKPYKPNAAGETQKQQTKESLNQKVRVFFEKYGNDFSEKEPNWHYWWRQIGYGGVKNLKDFVYNAELEDKFRGGECGGNVRPDFICGNPPKGYPRIMRLSDFSPIYQISNLAPTVGDRISPNNWGYTGEAVGAGSTKRGMEALAAVISHEQEHGRMKKNLFGGKKEDCLIASESLKVAEGDNETSYARETFNFKDLQDMLNSMEKSGYNGVGATSAQREYYDAIVSIKANNPRTDFDADGIRDEDEPETNRNNPDTYGFRFAYRQEADDSFKKYWQNEYKTYGDNEFLARKAESSPVECKTTEDWAIPGTQKLPNLSGLKARKSTPKEVDQLFDGENKITYDAEIAKSRFQGRGTTAKKFLKSAGNDMVDLDAHTYSGVASAIPVAEELTDGESVRVLSVVPQVPNANTDGLFEALRFSVVLTNRMDYSFRVAVKGYLADNATNAIAWATSYIDLTSNGVTNVNLVFDGRLIGATTSEGYHLRCLIVELAGSDFSPLYYSAVDVCTTTEILHSRRFAKYEARILKGTTSLRISEDADGLKHLVASCDVESDSGRSYQLFGRLESTNCVMVSEARSEWFTVTSGCEKVEMVFNSSDLYRSAIEGQPLCLYTLSLVRNDGTIVESMTKAAMSPVISSVEFRTPDNAIDVMDEVVPNVVRSSDGKVDLITFDVKVANVRTEEISCCAWATLADTNNNSCATSIKPCSLTPGTNHVVVVFRSADICDSNKDGPYMLNEIRFATSAGVVMCYVKPTHTLIDLKVADFGGVPFAVKGTPQYREAVGKNPASVDVTVDVARPDTITASAMLVDGEGKYVAMARTSATVNEAGERTLTLAFDPDEITASGRRGPYTISYLLLKSGIEGVEDIRLEEFEIRDVSERSVRAFGPHVTTTTPAPVEHSWLESYPEMLTLFSSNYEAMANALSPGVNGGGKMWPDGSPYYVWQDFVAGTSPTNDSVFKAAIRMEAKNPVVTWEPDTPELRATRVYRTFGKKTLLDANWTDITDKDQSEYRFFKVKVEMP